MNKWVAEDVTSNIKDFTIEGQGKKLYNSPLIHRSLPRNMAAIIIVVKGDVKSKVMASPRGIKVMQLTAQVTITPPKMPVFITFLILNFQSKFFVQFDFFYLSDKQECPLIILKKKIKSCHLIFMYLIENFTLATNKAPTSSFIQASPFIRS